MSQEWADLMAEEPDSSAGMPFFDGNRVVVQIAPVWEDTIDTPAWVDVTDSVISADGTEGSTWGAESRWPVGDLDLECYDLVDEIADFISLDADTRLQAGSLIRVGMIDTVLDLWYPQFSGQIDKITEAPKPGPRTWNIKAYDVLYPSAGADQQTFWGSITAGVNDLGFLIELILGSYLDIRFGWVIPTFGASSCDFDIEGNLHALIHRLADSGGYRLWGDPAGYVRVQPWGDVGVSADTTIRAYAAGSAGVFGEPTWSTSNGRIASILHASSPDGAVEATTPPGMLLTMNGRREDAPGWPKNDLLFQNLDLADEVTAAAARYAEQLTIERIDIDSLRNQQSDDIVNLLRGWGAGDGIWFENSVTSPTLNCLVLGKKWHIDRDAEKPRWKASYYPKIIEEVV